MAYSDLENLDHDSDLAAALGNMVIAWAYAESAVCATIARVTGININMSLMSYQRIPTFESRTKFLQALIGEWRTTKYDKDSIAKEADGLSGCAGARNGWVHNSWCINREKDEVVIFDFRRHEDKGRRRPVKAADIRNHNAAVLRHSRELMRLIDRDSMWGE